MSAPRHLLRNLQRSVQLCEPAVVFKKMRVVTDAPFASHLIAAGALIGARTGRGEIRSSYPLFGITAVQACAFRRGDAHAFIDALCAMLIAFYGGNEGLVAFEVGVTESDALVEMWTRSAGRPSRFTMYRETLKDDGYVVARTILRWFAPRRLVRPNVVTEELRLTVECEHPERVPTRAIIAARGAIAQFYADSAKTPHRDAPIWLREAVARR